MKCQIYPCKNEVHLRYFLGDQDRPLSLCSFHISGKYINLKQCIEISEEEYKIRKLLIE